ncbi:N-acetylglucosaminyldiphosphodolichol N-acetylglucosaminyltransferase catalytic subunit alg13 [Podila verticillata]|nr:N-acetylglucosaminyldiphosphodolichol N-acetylglucosaminyltransferase catalytic subunit alg13 [Podila verticillata]
MASTSTSSTSSTPKRVFVTVGSTRFDKLVSAASSDSFVSLLDALTYTHLTIQHGQSPRPALSESSNMTRITVDTYQYKPTLHEDMKQADLIISHAGSGSILEALRLHKPLIVLVNEDLMDNHQLELGSALHDQGHLICASVTNIEDALKAKKYLSLTPFPDHDPKRFASFMDSKLGL